MKRSSLWTLLAGSGLALALALAGGCGQASSSPALGGETHWLQQCGGAGDSAYDCGAGLECVCGVCTAACTEDASCAALGPSAACAAPHATLYSAACGHDTPERLCVQRDTDIGMFGRPYDIRGCFQDLQLAAPAPGPDALYPCSLFPAHVRAPDGACWLFPDGCIPEGFEYINAVAEDACSTVNDTCPESLACDAEQVATIAGCLSCEAASQALSERVRATVSLYNVCNTDADCILESQGPTCAGQCPGPINGNFVAPFSRDLSRLNRGFCTNSGWSEKCGPASSGCDFSPPVCRDNVCVNGAEAVIPCAGRSLQSCERDDTCVLARAFPFNAAGQCFRQQPTDMACVFAERSCPPVLTPALDGVGGCFLFGDCLPDGFARAPDGNACSAANGTFCND